MAKGSTTFAVVFVMFGATAVGMFSANDEKPIITENPGWGTVSYDVPTDGSAPTAHSPLENIGYMSRKLKEQENWYSEMHGSVNTIIKQEVTTYKQFSEGVLISADISTSSMVNTAKQFCFVGDSVLWREAAVGASQYNGINTEWKTGDPVKISVDQFRTEYGLPATEFSVYVINEDTLLSATDVVDNGDGTFSQTYELNPQTDKAPFYYRQQMLKTGGLSKWPEFSSISVTYTFDSEWQVLKSEISESYSVTMGPVSTSCTATYVTVYEYGTEKTQSTAYSDYFSKFADKPNTDIPAVSDPTAAGCLASAFGSVLTGPATFELSLDLNGTALHGFVYVDVAQMDIRAKIGNIGVWYSDDTVYLSYGGLKLRMSVEELLGLVGTYLPSDSEGAGFDTDALLEQLGGGEFAVSDGKATLNAELSLMGLNLPVDFSFLLDEKNNATLEYVRADIALGEFSIGAELGFGEAELPALTDEERAGYIDIMPYAETLAELFTSDVLGAEIAYEGNGVSLAGSVSLSVADKAAQGTLAVGYSDDKISVNKTVAFAYKDGNAYLNLDGIKVKANAEEAIALIGNYVDLPEMKGFDLNALLAQVFTEQFADIFSAGESDDILTVTLKGTELLKALGIEFELGEVKLEAENGKLTASAYGANVTVTQGEAFTADTDGYTEIVKYAGYLAELFTTENLKAEVAYEGYGVKVSGQVQLNVKSLKAQAELTVTYGAVTKQIGVIYGDGEVYLEIDGLKVKANVQEAVELVSRFAELPESDIDATAIIEKVLSLNFGEVISLGESDDVLTVTLKGTELMKALGIEFELGEVKLEAENGKLTASAYGANVTVTQGEAFTADTDGYTEIVKYAGYLAELFTTENLKAEIAYEGYGVKVSGQVQLNIKSVKAQAELTVTYGAVTKQIGVIYGDGEVYLEIDGLKVKANVQEAVALVGRFVELPESDIDVTAIIEKVLSLNFGEVISLGESDDVLTVTLKGTELLKALGIEFELGEVKLEAENGKLTASAYGANVAVTQGEAFTADTDGYTEIVKYAGYLAELFTTENLKAEIAYEGYGVKVSGQVQLNIKSLKAQAELTVTYGAVTKQIGVIYGDGEVYLEIDGLKVKANVQEAVALVSRFVELPESDIDATAIIEKVLSLNFGEVVSLGESDDILTVTLKGTELLKALGIEFELGEVKLEAENGKLTASAYGANVTVTPGEAFTADTDGYTEIVKYAGYLAELFTTENLKAEIAYEGYGVKVSGQIQLNVKSVKAQAELTVAYGAVTKQIGVIYGDGEVYLEIDGLKVKANVQEAVALVSRFVELPESDIDATAIIEKVLSLNFGEVISLGESDDVLTVTLKGTELLKALGIEFELGEVKLEAENGKLTASAYGANVAVTQGEAFTADTDGYTEIVKYAGYLAELFTTENLKAEIAYEGYGVKVSGQIQLNIKSVKAQAELTVTYGAVTKQIGVVYGDGEVYLEIDGLKVKADVQEAVALVGRFVELPESDIDATAIIEKVLSLNFGEVISLGESDDILTVTLKGTELLKALGIEFELGEVKLEAENGKLTASAYGANVAVTQGEAFTADTDGYTEIVKYAGYLAELFTTENLKAEIAYEGYGVKVSGQIQLNVKSLKAQAELTVAYGAVTKQIGVIYGDGEVYLKIDGLKVKANVQEAVALVSRFAELPESNPEATEIIEKVLSLNFGEAVSLGEGDDVLTVTLKGTELMKALGIEFELGEVKLEAENGKLTASAYGANVTVTQGEAFTADTDGYVDVMPLLMKLPDIINRKAVSFRAAIDIQLDNKSIVTLDVKNGAVSWENGITVYLDATLIAVNTRHDITVFYDGNRVQVAYGAVGAELLTEEIPQLEKALNVLYGRIKTVVDEISDTKDSVMPESLNDLMNMAGAGADLSGAVENFNFADLLGKLEFCAPNGANGVLGLKLGALTAELTDEADGTIGLVLRADREKVTVWAEAYATALEGQFPAMPELDYLGIDDFADMLDYAGAAAELLTKDSYRLKVTGDTYSDDIATYPEGQRYGIDASFDYVSGGSFPVHVDLDNNNFWLDPKMYLHAKVMLTAYGAGENNLFVDLYLLDCDPTTGEGDGVLDVYLTVSQIGADSKNPLKFYIPADELMSLLASAVPMFGVENDTLNEMLVNRYLTPEMIGQLRVLGESLMKSLGFDNIFGGISLPIIPNIGAKTATDGERSGLFKSVVFSDTDKGERALTVTLDSDMMYGAEIPKDLSFTVTKAGELGKSQLTGIKLDNIYSDDTAVERTGVKATFSDVVWEDPDLGNGYNMCGVSSLLKTIVNSATHETAEPDENGNRYALNDKFYIDGSVKISLFGLGATVHIDGLSVKVDDGSIAVNLGLSYKSFPVVLKTDSKFEMTVQDNMVYMKRTDNPGTKKESVLYRVMPLDNFLGDILNQLIFIFNFSDFIAGQIRSSDTSTSSDTVVDWGSYLTSYSYEDAGEWNFTINGNILTNGVLGDIAVGLEADSENVLRTLNVSSSIYILSLTGELNYRNPRNVWEEGSGDVTNDVSKVLAVGMSKAIRETDWTQVTYVDGLPSEVTFIVDGEKVGKQPAAYDSSAKKLYADILYPAPEKRGHTLVWDKLDEDAPFTGSTTVNGRFVPNLYGVTLTSQMPIEGFDYENGRYVLHTEMEYGAKIEFEAFREVFEIYTVSDGDNVFELPDIPERNGKQGKWSTASISAQKATISAEYDFDTVVYASEIEYTYNGALYNNNNPYSSQFDVDSDRTLITPQADGYTFLGWFIHTENGWEKVETCPSSDGNDAVKITVEALWMSDLSVTVTGSKDYRWDWTLQYDYQLNAEITGGKLIGAFAAETTCETTYGYRLNKSKELNEDPTTSLSYKDYRASDSFETQDSSYSYGHAVVTVCWMYNGLTFETSTHGYVKL